MTQKFKYFDQNIFFIKFYIKGYRVHYPGSGADSTYIGWNLTELEVLPNPAGGLGSHLMNFILVVHMGLKLKGLRSR